MVRFNYDSSVRSIYLAKLVCWREQRRCLDYVLKGLDVLISIFLRNVAPSRMQRLLYPPVVVR